MLTGNKGEWSEIYTFFKLLSEGKLYAADADLNKIENIYYPIIKVLRYEANGNWEYVRNSDIKIVDGSSGNVLMKVPVKQFTYHANILLKKIKNSSGAFATKEIEEFMKKIRCTTIKAPSKDKTDITVVVHDLMTGFKPTLGFSIKSKLGRASTLFNASRATNFIYKITNLSSSIVKQINSITGRNKIRKRVKAIDLNKGHFEYYDMESEIFKLNLQIIDSMMPLILSYIILNYYRGKGPDLYTLTKIIEKENPCNYKMNHNHCFYQYKIKTFLTDVALGMIPATVWNGRYDATGGYIIVREDGEVVCYHIYNMNEFQDYLFKNTKLETPSTSRHKFGTLYKNKNDLFIKLNLQIRFTK